MKRYSAISIASIVLLSTIAGAAFAQGGRDDHPQPPRSQGDSRQQPPAPVSAAEQHRRADQQQQRTKMFQQHLDKQVPTLKTQAAQLEAQKRASQARVQQEYAVKLQQQQEQLRTAHRDYAHDPYVSAPHSYRYTFGGASHMTNQYGAEMLRSAVNNGYDQGFRAGQADRQDHWKSNYKTSLAYRDANFGYTGQYIDQGDYNYYFRQGFQRGYDDGFNSRTQYGTSVNGSYVVAGAILGGILGFALGN